MRNNNISLENLANLNTNYQEGNQANQYQGQLNNLQSIIDTQRRELELRNQRQAEQTRLARERQQAAERERQRQENARREQERLRTLMQNQQAQNQPSGPLITMTHPLGGAHGRTTFTNPNWVQGYLDQGWRMGY